MFSDVADSKILKVYSLSMKESLAIRRYSCTRPKNLESVKVLPCARVAIMAITARLIRCIPNLVAILGQYRSFTRNGY